MQLGPTVSVDHTERKPDDDNIHCYIASRKLPIGAVYLAFSFHLCCSGLTDQVAWASATSAGNHTVHKAARSLVDAAIVMVSLDNTLLG